MVKLIAFYLPQFHEIPENNKYWGKGFTEWTNVKKATPLFTGHQQPVEPLNDNYYDLSDVEIMRWQSEVAKKYGIYGFCFYHYWYNGHKLMQKPLEQFLREKDIDMPYCLCWANHDWTTSWADSEWRLIYKQNYTDKSEWIEHFNYLLPYFKDKRYIKNNKKPLLVIYEARGAIELKEMLETWNQLAIDNGFNGIEYAYQSSMADTESGFDDSPFTYNIEYQPQYAILLSLKKSSTTAIHKILKVVRKFNEKTFKLNIETIINKFRKRTLTIYDYDELWSHVLKMGPITKKSVPGAFVKFDTTPRLGKKGIVTPGMTPEKFGDYLRQQIIRARDVYRKDMIFIFAWNEWAEGGYLEPDKQNGYRVLEAVKWALEETGEMP